VRFLIIGIFSAVLIGGIFSIFNKPTGSFNFDNLKTIIPKKLTVLETKKEEEINSPLKNPPKEIKAVYLTSWSAGINSRIEKVIKLIKETELNSVVIDIKDFSGLVAYDTKLKEVEIYKTKEIRIPDLDNLIKRLHQEGIYVIARITVFQDPALVKARPDLAVFSKSRGAPWKDSKGITWVDPASHEVWDYNVAVARDAASKGFDELNFDYIRFPSDGDVGDIEYRFWDGKTPRAEVIRSFYKYLRESLPNIKISADVFGQTTVNFDDLGIGQIIEDAYRYFDYVSPMIYPSHFNPGFLNFPNPALHPYEVVRHTMESALLRLRNHELRIMNNGASTTSPTSNSSFIIHNSKLRPWLQAFDLGAVYTPAMIRSQIKALYDAASSTLDKINGFVLWNPSNIYNQDIFDNELN